jgi:hypothetical protein
MIVHRRLALLATPLLAVALLAAPSLAKDHAPRPWSAKPLESKDPQVYIVNLVDGQTVTSPVRVIFGLSGKGIAPAGVDKENTGHHHLLIDTTDVTPGQPLPAQPGKVNHYGAGQTEAVIELTPGPHTLMLVFADKNHVPFDPPIQSKPIKITVKAPAAK